ncbi:DNA polymerase III subunit gamma/tau [Marinomonas algicola]|uniref:DNA polymerase III subunit gamma/tau n=1 Tax=Marinomonas algicola TaxID=2773454 RepID=UPI0017480198|nr:DNA polymerase III subunit gamma/tau [Marinomonas algicola]
MSYQVLARKWRPQTFLEMAGQDHVLQALVNALRQQRLHHAYLFTGTRGVGKTTIARIFAKCLNCETNGISPEPCGTCSSCTEIAEGRFVDLIEVDAASRTKVEDTRELLENVQYAPTRGRFKVYLIDEVHMLSTHSFNALLKTLEEPPAHVKFLLATTDPQKLPVTVLSRCLQFNLKNMSSARVVNYLTKILGEEKLSFEEAALWQIGQAANGSMRDALSLTDQAIAFGDGVISEIGVTSMLGLVNQSQILNLLELIASNDALGVLNKVNELAEYQPDFVALCASLMDALHRIAIEQQVPNALEDQFGDLERIKSIAQRLAPEEVQLFYQSLLIGRRDLHLAHSPKSGFEMLMLRLIAFRPSPPVKIEMSAESVVPINVSAEKPSDKARDSTGHSSSRVDESYSEALEEASAPSAVPHVPMKPVDSPPWEEESVDTAHKDKTASSEPHIAVSDSAINHPVRHQEMGDAAVMSGVKVDDKPLKVSSVKEKVQTVSLSDKAVLAESPDIADENVDTELKEAVAPVIEESPSQIKKQIVDDTQTDSDEEEQAINESLDPHFSMSDMVSAISVEDESTLESNDADSQLSKTQKQVVDTVAQPALGMPLPTLSRFSELTMQTWWLVAPRLELTGLVQNILMNSGLIEATHLGLKIQVPLEYGHMLNQVRYEQIKQALGDFFGTDVPLIIDTVEEVACVTAEEFAASKRAEALQAAIDHLNVHPIVKGLGERLGGQLIYESVKVKA